MRDALSLTYERISEGFYSNDSDDEETALAAGQFKGRCNKCGKYGHKSADCRGDKSQSAESSSGKFDGDCFYCKKPGHREINCWKKKKDKGEHANSSVEKKKKKKKKKKVDDDDDDQAEVVLMVIEESEEDDESEFVHVASKSGTKLGPAYYKTWQKYNPDGSFKSFKTREVNDILLSTDEVEEEMAFSVTEASDDEDNEGVNILESELRHFMRKVAEEKRIKPMNVESWMDAVIYKLSDIGMTTVSDLRRGIITINRNLTDKGHSILHTKTLIVIAKVAEDDYKERMLSMCEEMKKLTKELAFSRSQMETVRVKKEDTDDEEQDQEWSEANEMAFMAKEEPEEKEAMTPNTWLGDSAASCHLCNDDDGMFEWKHINSPVKIGNGKALMATKIGKLRRTIIQKNGDTIDVVLKDVKYVPDL